MSAASSSKITDRVADVENAFKWIVSHPAQHKTKCRFIINSDWGEIGLLTPSAFIEEDPDSKPSTEFVLSSTKISWGREHSYSYKKDVTVE